MRFAPIFLVLLILPGCAGLLSDSSPSRYSDPAPRVWLRPPTMSLEQGERELAACQRDSMTIPVRRSVGRMTGIVTVSYEDRENYLSSCMRAKGFVLGSAEKEMTWVDVTGRYRFAGGHEFQQDAAICRAEADRITRMNQPIEKARLAAHKCMNERGYEYREIGSVP